VHEHLLGTGLRVIFRERTELGVGAKRKVHAVAIPLRLPVLWPIPSQRSSSLADFHSADISMRLEKKALESGTDCAVNAP